MTEEIAPKTTPTGYTEEQLLERHIGKRDVNQKEDYGWPVKRSAYKELGVYTEFNLLRHSLKPLLTDWKAYTNEEWVNKIAVLIMDTYLIRKSRGVKVSVPQPVVPKNAQIAAAAGGSTVAPVITLFDMEAFGDNADAEIDVIKDLNWIYKNIAVKNLKPADAPSPGAYAHLQYIQTSEQNMLDFYTKVYPRLIPAKSQLDKANFNDDDRKTFDLLDRLSSEGGGDTA